METKAVTTKNTAMAAMATNTAWGADDLSSDDVVIPSLLLMQGLSKLVGDEKAKMGELANSATGEVLGGVGKPVEFVPFKSYREWALFEDVDGQLKFSGAMPITPANTDLPWKEVVNGKMIKRVKCLNFFVRLVRDFGKADQLPYLLSFRSTSFKVGRVLVTEIKKGAALKQPIAYKTFKLSSRKEKNAAGQPYYMMVLETGRLTKEAELLEAFELRQMVDNTRVKIDNSDVGDVGGEVDVSHDTTPDSSFVKA